MSSHAVTRRTERGGVVTLQVTDNGPTQGGPVLLLHGFPQHRGMWDDVTAALNGSGLLTRAVDQRGYGSSTVPDDESGYRLDELVADALAVLDDLEARPAVVVGHDWGAVVAWALAARHPDRVRALVAVSVPHPAAFASALASSADQQRRSAYIDLFRHPERAEPVLLAGGGRRLRAMFDPLPGDVAARYVEPLLRPGALLGPLRWYAGAMRPDVLAAVPPVTVPTVFVWSDADTAVSRAAADACAQQVTGPYRRVDVPGVSHWVPDERPEVVVEAVFAALGLAGEVR